MFCPKCGKEVNNDAVVCVNCGCSLEQKKEDRAEYKDSKTGLGVVLALFLGLIGLIIGLCMYPEGKKKRKTFLKAWGITFGVSVAVYVMLFIILFSTVLGTAAKFAGV